MNEQSISLGHILNSKNHISQHQYIKDKNSIYNINVNLFTKQENSNNISNLSNAKKNNINNQIKNNQTKIKILLAKEIEEIYHDIFLPALEEMESFKYSLETKIKTKQFGNITKKIQSEQLKIVNQTLKQFMKDELDIKIQNSLCNIEKEFNFFINENIENKEVNIETYLDKVMDVILDIYLDMKKVQISLIERIIALVK
ncbi:MAG: hypothetical protein U1E31_02925 [Rickettsiales bacterium]